MAGAHVIWAGNHWRLACHYHQANHPEAHHECQDLQQADWTAVPDHDLMLASPCCQGHSRGRDRNRPHHDTSRNTAWAVVACAEAKRPSVIVVENVEEFLQWSLYPSWQDALKRLGYAQTTFVIDAADHGVPQNRVRLFMVFTRSKHAIELRFDPAPHVAVESFIDWDYAKWNPVRKKGRSRATLSRIKAGREAFGDRFVAPFYSNGSGLTGRALTRPLGTVTTRDRWAVIDGKRMRMLQPHELRSIMGFPANYQLPETRREAIHLLGNAVCPPVAAAIIQQIRRAA